MEEKKHNKIYISLIIIFLLIIRSEALFPLLATGGNNKNNNKHIVLVHGACHGAWCWYKIIHALSLRSSGYKVTAIDLAASGIDLRRAENLRSLSDYTRPLMDLMKSLPPQERVTLVGHSYGGIALSQAMQLFPNKISVAVFVTAFMPGPSFNVSTLFNEYSKRQIPDFDNRCTYDDGPNNPPTTEVFGPTSLKKLLYQLSPIEDWTLATTLVRPYPLISDEELSRELVLTKDKYGLVKKVYIIAEEDLIIKMDFQLLMIQRNPTNEILNVSGSDHMVMMSKPIDLSTSLPQIAQRYS